jgi:hypothetical protein
MLDGMVAPCVVHLATMGGVGGAMIFLVPDHSILQFNPLLDRLRVPESYRLWLFNLANSAPPLMLSSIGRSST